MKSYRKKIAGVLGKRPHQYHRHWEFSYQDCDHTRSEAFLDNDDLEECPYKKQICIVKKSVLLYIGETDTSVTVDLYLPTKVKMIVIHKYRKQEPFCFVTVSGGLKFSVYHGKELKNDPYANRLQ